MKELKSGLLLVLLRFLSAGIMGLIWAVERRNRYFIIQCGCRVGVGLSSLM